MTAVVVRCLRAAAAVLAGIALAAPALAQQPKTVGGMVVNFGIVPAEVALRADGHRDQHPAHPPPGSQHLLITLDDEKTHQRLSDAEVVIEVVGPNGHVEKKPMLHTQGGGLADYSELYRFPSPGDYTVRVIITPKSGGKPIETQFKVKHAI